MTAYAEVIGDPIAHSRSPAIHNFWINRLALDAEYRATHTSSGGLKDYFKQRRGDADWRGCNVTMPHKRTVMPLLDVIDDTARRIGAVNTVYRRDGALVGTNTDGVGFLEPIMAMLAQPHLFRMARILGAGGAARAIATALANQGFTLVVAARDPDKASSLLAEIAPGADHHVISIDHFAEPTDFAFDDRQGCCDLIVNTTPLGMRGHAPLAFDWSHAPPGSTAYDIVTDPVRTPFLADAQAYGFKTIDGLHMLIGQAAHAFEHFFMANPPRGDDEELRTMLVR